MLAAPSRCGTLMRCESCSASELKGPHGCRGSRPADKSQETARVGAFLERMMRMAVTSPPDIAKALQARGIPGARIQPLAAGHPKSRDGVIARGAGQPALEVAVLPT